MREYGGQRTIAYAFAFVGCVIAVIDGMMMARGAMGLAPDHGSGHLFFKNEVGYAFAAIGVVAAIAKAGWLDVARRCLSDRKYVTGLIVCLFGLLLHTFSMVVTMGLSASGRDSEISTRKQAQETRRNAQYAYDNARARRAAIGPVRAVPVIRTDLEQAERDVAAYKAQETAERATACDYRCRKAIAKGEAAKRRVAALKGELATAQEVARIDADIERTGAALNTAAAPMAADPISEAVAKLSNGFATTESVATFLPLLPSLVLEVGGPISLMIAGLFFSLGRASTEPTYFARRRYSVRP